LQYLNWHEGPINVGLEIYSAGFPLGEPQFTLTRGIVLKEDPQAFLVLVEMQIAKDSDFDVLDQILATFDVVGSLP